MLCKLGPFVFYRPVQMESNADGAFSKKDRAKREMTDSENLQRCERFQAVKGVASDGTDLIVAQIPVYNVAKKKSENDENKPTNVPTIEWTYTLLSFL